jgi:hypothetical protein
VSPLPADVIEEFVARCRRERAEAGLPPKVEDETVLNRLAVIFAPAAAGATTHQND